jgi:hypothetical protein
MRFFMKRIKALALRVLGILEMRGSKGPSALFPLGAVALGLGAPAWAAPFSAARLIFEVNATAGDAGIQLFLDGQPWENIMILNPDGDPIFNVQGTGNLEGFGNTELFSESNEPPFDEVPLSEVLARFPAGKYTFQGTAVDGASLKSMADLTHDIPCGPEIVSPEEGGQVNPNNAVIDWEEVTHMLDPATGECDEESSQPEIVGYQVIVEQQNPNNILPLVFSVFVPATTTIVTVPQGFIQADTKWLFEVLAIEESGNQTITEGSFETQ